MLNFRLFISNFKLLSNQVFRFALSHSLRVKEQIVQSLTIPLSSNNTNQLMVIQNPAGFHVPCSNKHRACIYKAQKLVRETLKPRYENSNAGGNMK